MGKKFILNARILIVVELLIFVGRTLVNPVSFFLSNWLSRCMPCSTINSDVALQIIHMCAGRCIFENEVARWRREEWDDVVAKFWFSRERGASFYMGFWYNTSLPGTRDGTACFRELFADYQEARIPVVDVFACLSVPSSRLVSLRSTPATDSSILSQTEAYDPSSDMFAPLVSWLL